MRVTFVLSPTQTHGGGTRMIAQATPTNLRRRGHSVTNRLDPSRGTSRSKQKVGKLAPRPRSGPKARKGHPSHLDGPRSGASGVEPSAAGDRSRRGPDADVVIATWWETAKGVAQLSPSKGGQGPYFIQHYEAMPRPSQSDEG